MSRDRDVAKDQLMGEAPRQRRHWVSVLYRCCNVYHRVYFAVAARTAIGHCPRCLREVRFVISEDAEPGKFFCAEAGAGRG